MASGEYIVEMSHVTKLFAAVKALDDVSLKIRPGSVHALMGENGAGKSTLMKCLFGIYQRDGGEVLLDGTPVNFQDSREALLSGITMIHQELQPEPFLTVKENIWIGRLPVHGIGPFQLIDSKKLYRDSLELLKKFNLSLNPNSIVGDLSVSQMQSVEIVKAVSYNAKVIIMDEPTSSLTENETETLFQIISDLKQQGVAIIYISHKMEEILRISDEVSIMRDGQMMGTWKASELTTDLIISRMVGRDLSQRFPPKNNRISSTILEVKNYTSPTKKSFQDISFSLKRGEILGIGGLVGAQRTELMEAIFGIRAVSAGEIFLDGQKIKINSPAAAMDHGLALLTEDRRQTGIFPVLSVQENIVMASMKRYCKAGFLLKAQLKKVASENSGKLRIKAPSFSAPIRNLSGGNQQKVLFARWLMTNPQILLLDEPTRGIDVGTKYEIYTIITELAAQGKSIIIISSETPELIGLSDRIVVLCEGKKAGELEGPDITEQAIMHLATKFMV